MKAITILEPWASLILGGTAVRRDGQPVPLKRIENRSWETSYRGPLAIHAGLSKRMLRSEDGRRNTNWAAVELAAGMMLDVDITPMTFGAVIGVVDLVECIDLSSFMRHRHNLAPSQQKYAWVLDDPYTEGEWLWVLENPRRLAKPIPWKGKQKLFDVPDELFA